jgi:hypothetical protein
MATKKEHSLRGNKPQFLHILYIAEKSLPKSDLALNDDGIIISDPISERYEI